MRVLVLLAALFAPACGGADSPPSAGAPAPGGALTVQEALETDAQGPLLVRGYVVSRGADVRLCSALAESYPPQCGGPSLRVLGSEHVDLGELERARGTAWTEKEVALLGDVDGGVFRVSATSR